MVTEQKERQKKRLVEIRFYLTFEEFINMEEMAMYIYKQGAIQKPSVNSFAKSSAYKWYNEINERLKRGQNGKNQLIARLGTSSSSRT
jgi:hypothetical protein